MDPLLRDCLIFAAGALTPMAISAIITAILCYRCRTTLKGNTFYDENDEPIL